MLLFVLVVSNDRVPRASGNESIQTIWGTTMKTSIPAWLGSMLLAIFATSVAIADDHMLNGMNVQAPFNVQANLCKLTPDVTLDDYHALVEDYFDWAESHSVDPVFVRQFPLFSHQNIRNLVALRLRRASGKRLRTLGQVLGSLAHL